MLDDKPLYVQVAEALGWWDIRYIGGLAVTWASHHGGRKPGEVIIIGQPDSGVERIPRYDTDWSTTGPLIEKYGISLRRGPRGWTAVSFPADARPAPSLVWHLDPLGAACGLILALHEAGKLKPSFEEQVQAGRATRPAIGVLD